MKSSKELIDILNFDGYITSKFNFLDKTSNDYKIYKSAKKEAKKILNIFFEELSISTYKIKNKQGIILADYKNIQVIIYLGYKSVAEQCAEAGHPAIQIYNKNTNNFLFFHFFKDCGDMFTNYIHYKNEIIKILKEI